MGKVNRLSEDEKNCRLRLLEKYDRWSEESKDHSMVRYCEATGSDHTYLVSCMKWRTSLRPAPDANGTGFVRLEPVKERIGEPVRVSVGNVLIEVGETSSREALAMVLSTLGVAHVL